MNFTIFDRKEHLPVLIWLGKRSWVSYKDFPEKRAVSIRPRPILFAPTQEQIAQQPQGSNPLVVSQKEMDYFPKEHWRILKDLLRVLEFDVISTFWYFTLAKSLAGGPKLFRPTTDQCIALEKTDATFPFDIYHQPFPVVILQIPDDYRSYLQTKYGVTDTPSHVLVHHDDQNKYIAVSAFLSMTNIITHLTPRREEYETIEDSITKNRDRRVLAEEGRITMTPENEADFNAAENVQRLAMNFAMMMTLLGIRDTGPINPEEYCRWQQESRATRRGGIPTHRAVEAQENLASSIYILHFDQKIEFYDEKVERIEVGSAVELDRLHKSPKTHWRRGHWCMQPYGVGRKERKAIFRKPILVRALYFVGDTKNTSVTYTAHPPRE